MIPMYNTRTFNEIFENAADFKANYDLYQAAAGQLNLLDETDCNITWQLLSARYGNSPIANWSEDQFKLKVWQIMFEYGPTWVKKLDIQHTLRNLTDDQIMLGAKAIYNAALNPAQAPSTDTLDEVQYINQQNVSKRVKNRVQAYGELESMLDTDVTNLYISKFKKLFMTVVDPSRTLIYATDEGED